MSFSGFLRVCPIQRYLRSSTVVCVVFPQCVSFAMIFGHLSQTMERRHLFHKSLHSLLELFCDLPCYTPTVKCLFYWNKIFGFTFNVFVGSTIQRDGTTTVEKGFDCFKIIFHDYLCSWAVYSHDFLFLTLIFTPSEWGFLLISLSLNESEWLG